MLYKLTKKGIDLLPVMIEINLWTEKYYPIPADRKAMLKEVKKDKEGFIKASVKELEKARQVKFFPVYYFQAWLIRALIGAIIGAAPNFSASSFSTLIFISSIQAGLRFLISV